MVVLKHYILDENGNPQIEDDFLTWARWFETADCDVAKTKIAVGKPFGPLVFTVSTIFLGLDHQWGIGPPLLYESIVFVRDQEHDDVDYPNIPMRRYATREAALQGHDEMVADLRRRMGEATS